MEVGVTGWFNSTHLLMDTRVSPLDMKYYRAEPDPGFSIERNKRVIADSIKKYEVMRRKRQKYFTESLGERIDAIVSWSKSGKNTNSIEKYLGKRIMSEFRGQEIRQELIERLNAFRAKNPHVIL